MCLLEHDCPKGVPKVSIEKSLKKVSITFFDESMRLTISQLNDLNFHSSLLSVSNILNSMHTLKRIIDQL